MSAFWKLNQVTVYSCREGETSRSKVSHRVSQHFSGDNDILKNSPGAGTAPLWRWNKKQIGNFSVPNVALLLNLNTATHEKERCLPQINTDESTFFYFSACTLKAAVINNQLTV